jgi:iron complex outermembrane recepter protein
MPMFSAEFRRVLLALTTVTTMPSIAVAQTAADEAAQPGVAEIIVTARRDNERLQDVPASITVLTEDEIRKAGVTVVDDVIALTPGVTIVTNTAEVGDTQINIRGINGARDAESSVALVVDGILKTNSSVLNQPQGSLRQVEVLKGPQGAYYGRNAAAGAVVITTQRPGDELAANTRVYGGNNSTYGGDITVSGPLTDRIGLLVSADLRDTDGFFRNDGPFPDARGATIDQFRGWNINGRLIAELSEAAELDVKAKIGRYSAGSINFNAVFNLPGLAAIDPGFNADVNDRKFTYLSNLPSDGDQETTELSARLDVDLGATRLTGWVLHSDVEQDLAADAAAAAFGFWDQDPICRDSVATLNSAGVVLPPPFVLGEVPDSSLFVPNGSLLGTFSPTTCDGTEYQVRNQQDTSAELRWSSNGDGPLRWSVGAYYLNIEREVGVNLAWDKGEGILRSLFNDQASSNPTEELLWDTFDTDVYAGFGSIDYDLTDRWALSAALRYDREDRSVRNLVDPDARNQWVLGGNAPLNVGLLFGPLLPQSADFDQWQPRLSATFKATADWTIYGVWGVGFKSGGFNNQGSEAALQVNFNDTIDAGLNVEDRFREETSSAFELGTRFQALDGRFNASAAAYYTRIDDLQFFEFYNGSFGILRVVSNVDAVEITGFELGASLAFAEFWQVFGSVNVNDSEILRNNARPGTEGGKSPYTSDYTANLGATVTFPLTDRWELQGRVDYRLTGPTWFSTAQTGDRPTIFNAILPLAGFPAELGTGNFTNSERDAFGIVNARLGLQGEHFGVAAFATNLFEEEYLAEVIPAPEFGGSFVAPGERRAYGLELSYRF